MQAGQTVAGVNFTFVTVNVTSLWKARGFGLSVTWVHNLLRSVIPLTILVVLNCYIVRALRRTRSNRKKLSSRNRITLTLIAVIVVFLVCVTPDAVMSTFFGFGYTDADYLVRGIREFTDLLLAVNSSVNFILYCTFNKMFRKQFQQMFCKRCDEPPALSNIEQEETCARRTSFPGRELNAHAQELDLDPEVDDFDPDPEDAEVRASLNGSAHAPQSCPSEERLWENEALQTSL